MSRILFYAILFFTIGATAQDFQWQWAKRGGGIKECATETPQGYAFEAEHIEDIAVDADNNYYFLAFIGQQYTEFDGTPITVYNADSMSFSLNDMVIISTDCEGTLRWTQTIGGADRDFAYKLVLDNNGGLYIGANVMNVSGSFPNTYLPPHFSPDDAMPILGDFNNGEPQEGFKTMALLKYNTADGSLAWRVMPQGETPHALRLSDISQILIHPDGSIVALIGLRAGTHLNGQIVVPDSFTNNFKYHLVKFNPDGGVISVLPLAMEGRLMPQQTLFKYDANLDRYYLAGYRNFGGTDPFLDLSFGGIPFTQQAYILAFNGQGNEVWRREVIPVSQFSDNKFHDLEIDTDSNLYLCGRYFVPSYDISVTMGGYEFPRSIIGNTGFVMKVNSEGAVQWMRVPSGYTVPIFSGMDDVHDIAIKGDKLVVATQVSYEIWGNIPTTRPLNHLSDPALLTFDKATGTPTAVNDIMGIGGYDDAFTSIAIDNDGNYVAGGYFRYNLFTASNDNVPTLTKVQNEGVNTDFFMAKFASSPCGSGLKVAEFDKETIDVFPNPATTVLNIQTKELLAGYEITGMLGQVLLKGNLAPGQQSVFVGNLSSGMYVVRFKTLDGKIFNVKIMKE